MMKLESDKRVVCEGSCKECVRCLRLDLCDAEDCGGMSVWRTWLDNRIALSNSSSSAMLHSSLKVGRFAGQYLWRLAIQHRVDVLAVWCFGETAPRAGGVRQSSDDGGTVDVMQSVVVQSAGP